MKKSSKTALALIVTLAVYTLWWSFWYRLPAMPDQTVDMRTQLNQPAGYITFCAGLADNPIGFPGHAYVVWSELPKVDPLQAQSVGYISKLYNDQFISPFIAVPGMLHFDAARYNQRNLEQLTAIVDQNTYQKTLQARNEWKTEEFKALDRDCLSFCTYIAKAAGLNVPAHRCLYPQDQIKQLKELNKTRRISP